MKEWEIDEEQRRVVERRQGCLTEKTMKKKTNERMKLIKKERTTEQTGDGLIDKSTKQLTKDIHQGILSKSICSTPSPPQALDRAATRSRNYMAC